MNRDRAYLIACLAFAGLTAIFLLAANFVPDTFRLSQILVIISGMSTMGSFSFLQRFMERPIPRLVKTPVRFNEEFLSTTIAQAFEPISEDRVPFDRLQLPPWELASDQLIGKDNALALAKLRIDLESELRRLAFHKKVRLPERPTSAMQIARILVDEKYLPPEMLNPFQDVIAVCNRAIHGETIPDALASSVVRIGNQLLDQLRQLSW